jgi:hypothetical protein
MAGGYIVTRQVVDVAFMGPLFPAFVVWHLPREQVLP